MKSTLRKIVLFCAALAGMCAYAQTGTGSSCSDPILLTPGYQQRIQKAGTVWYVANTFDLPLAITYYPSNENAAAPEIYLDFGCTPGVYEDPILCGLFCSSNSAYVSLPYQEIPPKTYDEAGHAKYTVEFGQFYRDMLLRQGIDYNVPVYVRVVFSTSGELTMEPDAFNSCMDNAKFMHLGDTVNVQAYDKQRHVIVPYVQWQYDSIRYVWQGTQPCQFAVGNKCDFDPTVTSGTIIDMGTIQPGEAFKVSSELLMQYVSDQVNFPNDAGMYFAKFYSEAPGVMKIEKIPAPAPDGGAELLKYGVATNVYRNDTSKVYAFPTSWVKAMQFTTPTDYTFRMYIGKTADFYLKDAIATYQFDRTEDGHELQLMASDMAALWQNKVAGSQYLYVRFQCAMMTTVTPALWTPSDCMEKVTRIERNKQFDVAATSKVIYSLYYEDWKGGDMTISWTSSQAPCYFFIADTCVIPNSADDPAVFYHDTVPKKGSVVCAEADVDSWEPYVDPDGFLYIRFYSKGKAKITVSTAAEPEADPDCGEIYDSIATVVAFEPYYWRGQRFTRAGDYMATSPADPTTGCVDTVYVLHLSFGTTTTAEETMSNCDSIVYGGKKYTLSGDYMDTTVTGNKRVITALHLTIPHSSTYEERVVMEDEPFVSPQGVTYTEPGVYQEVLTNAEGCDSVITYRVLILTTEYQTITETGCDSLMYYGKTYTATGVYADTIHDEIGNTLILTLDLTIHPATYGELAKRACESYWLTTGQRITESGDYIDTLTNHLGCDSIVSLHLTVLEDCYTTVCFCLGTNYEHVEDVDGIITTYKRYAYEEPSEDWYMEGVILTREHDRTLVDFKRAETNLYAHYTGDLTPIKSITWTYRPFGDMVYSALETAEEPKWVDAGSVTMVVRFACGQVYSTRFETEVETVKADEKAGQKVLMNGRLVIIRGGKTYDVLGNIVSE